MLRAEMSQILEIVLLRLTIESENTQSKINPIPLFRLLKSFENHRIFVVTICTCLIILYSFFFLFKRVIEAVIACYCICVMIEYFVSHIDNFVCNKLQLVYDFFKGYFKVAIIFFYLVMNICSVAGNFLNCLVTYR